MQTWQTYLGLVGIVSVLLLMSAHPAFGVPQ